MKHVLIYEHGMGTWLCVVCREESESRLTAPCTAGRLSQWFVKLTAWTNGIRLNRYMEKD